MSSPRPTPWCYNCGHDRGSHCQRGLFDSRDGCMERRCPCAAFVGIEGVVTA